MQITTRTGSTPGSRADAHLIVRDFRTAHSVNDDDFRTWFMDGGYDESFANVHDSKHLALLERYVEERDADFR